MVTTKIESEIKNALQATFGYLQRHVNRPALEDAIKRKDAVGILKALGIYENAWESLTKSLEGQLDQALQSAFYKAASDTAASIEVAIIAAVYIGATVSLRQSITTKYANTFTSDLGIATSLVLRSNVAPAIKANRLIDSIGLSATQATSLHAFSSALDSALAERSKPQLRIKGTFGNRVSTFPSRIDPDKVLTPLLLRNLSASQRSIVKAAITRGLDRETAETLIKDQAEKLRNHRIKSIAATEATRMANAGSHRTVEEAINTGQIKPGSIRRHWVTAGDEKVRTSHAAVPGMNPVGVEVNKPFLTPLGPVHYPPLEINCRCRVEFRRVAQ
jgi:hypothetical protein